MRRQQLKTWRVEHPSVSDEATDLHTGDLWSHAFEVQALEDVELSSLDID